MAGQEGQAQAGQKAVEQVDAAAKAAAEAVKADAVESGKGDAAKPEVKPKGYKVVGAAAVLRGEDKSERYLYKGAPFDGAAFSKESIKHNLSVGLIEKVK